MLMPCLTVRLLAARIQVSRWLRAPRLARVCEAHASDTSTANNASPHSAANALHPPTRFA